jgi:pimeloyl-ACP methyl ester carboxylesterase
MNIYRTSAGALEVQRHVDAVLADWPVPYDGITVPTRNGDTFVIASGPPDAPPLIALQGSAASAVMWRPQVAAWSARRRVLAVDVIGEPGRSAHSRPPLSTDDHAQWMDDVLDGLGHRRVALVGVSLGGWLATDYALRRPGRVNALALLNPSGIGARRPGFLIRAVLLSLLGERGRRRTLARVRGAVTGPPTPDEQALVELALVTFRHFRPRLDPIPTFTDAQLASLAVPVLAVLGARDVMLDAPGTARRIEAHVPRATVHLLPEAGHLLPDPATTVLDFLTSETTGGVADDAARPGR